MRKYYFISIICLTIFIQNQLYAQFFRLGGNLDNAGANGLISNTNYFGATQTASVRLGTGNVSRIFIGGTNYTNPGFVGIGTNFTTPRSLVHLDDVNTNQTFMQFTNTLSGNNDTRCVNKAS